jgi:hypothetical protein
MLNQPANVRPGARIFSRVCHKMRRLSRRFPHIMAPKSSSHAEVSHYSRRMGRPTWTAGASVLRTGVR